MVNAAPDKGPVSAPSIETKALIVSQPKRLEGILQEIGNLQTETISETSAGGPSNSWSGSDDGAKPVRAAGPSPRDQAIARIPAEPILRTTLRTHIEKEIVSLRTEARRIVRISRPGHAYQLNEIYAKIRRLNALLTELLTAMGDMVKRIYIRVFIDRQPVLQDQ